ncbi:MAG: adenylate/guanylate cyclase domain-containing protein [Chloroflexi bacterium]|nr:adenylate/guanylate cyclase domain-containing protein [Chloroflexota bacterium]
MARHLRDAVPVIVFFVIVALTWDNVRWYLAPEDGPREPLTVMFIGVLLALPLIVLESSALAERFRRLPFWAAVLLKTVTYVTALAAIFLGLGLILGLLEGRTFDEFVQALPQNLAAMATAFLLYLVIIFLWQLDRLLGPGVLLRYVTGRYHRPRREHRIFMFVDITSSTELSERLSLEAYYGLVNDFFHDVSGPVLDTRGEIYEYVGDEVVITWKLDLGIENANCVKAFFQIDQAVRANADRYIARYGVVPDFKAGLHSGEVIAAEMGDLKKEIAFNGEVLNMTARIQGECPRLDRRFLASRSLLDRLNLPAEMAAEPMGAVALRGVGEPTEIVAFL